MSYAQVVQQVGEAWLQGVGREQEVISLGWPSRQPRPRPWRHRSKIPSTTWMCDARVTVGLWTVAGVSWCVVALFLIYGFI